ncbi:MAG: hypothetical protein HRF46_06195 [Acidobacteriota bacterium]|jgi:hypothetical protein
MDILSLTSYGVICLTGVSAIVNALLKTERKEDGAECLVFVKRLSSAGYLMIVIAIATTVLAVAFTYAKEKRAGVEREAEQKRVKDLSGKVATIGHQSGETIRKLDEAVV